MRADGVGTSTSARDATSSVGLGRRTTTSKRRSPSQSCVAAPAERGLDLVLDVGDVEAVARRRGAIDVDLHLRQLAAVDERARRPTV